MSNPRITLSLLRGLDVDGSERAKAFDFIQKLQNDPTAPGLHIEPIKNSADPRVRTGRVDLSLRAVLFELTDTNHRHFLVEGIYNHDDAIERAKQLILRVNPVNGITELVRATTPAPPSKAEIESKRKADAAARAALEAAANEATVDVSEPTPATVFEEAGLTADLLERELGIDPAATELFLTLEDETDFNEALADCPQWEADALIGLLAGMSVDEVRDDLSIKRESPAAGASEDEQLIAGLKTAAAQMEFAYLEDTDSETLRQVIEAEDFDAWRIFIHPNQRDIVERNFSGSGRVLGGAGTGKTVVVVHRANRLVTSDGTTPRLKDNPPRVLMTTFTRGLADSLKSQMNALNPTFPEAGDPGHPGLWIGGVDSVIRKIINQATLAERSAAVEQVLGRANPDCDIVQANDEKSRWFDAQTLNGAEDLDDAISNRPFLNEEFENVVLANHITNQRAYLKVARPGRGTALNRAERKKVWPMLESFMLASARAGTYTYATLAAIAAAILDKRAESGQRRLFDHVLVDEAQDFHVGHWQFLRACVAPGPNDIFLAEDSHQRIYRSPLVLSRFGISTRGRASARLTLNYRTTRENLNYAVQMLEGTDWINSSGEDDSVHGYRSARTGPTPRHLTFETESEQFEAIAELIQHWRDTANDPHIGLLTRTLALNQRVVAALSQRGITAVKTKNAELASHETVSVMTMHGAKGMEFTHVILVGMDDKVLPLGHQLEGLSDADRADALNRERSLLYVAATRARDELVVTSTGHPSKLLPNER